MLLERPPAIREISVNKEVGTKAVWLRLALLVCKKLLSGPVNCPEGEARNADCINKYFLWGIWNRNNVSLIKKEKKKQTYPTAWGWGTCKPACPPPLLLKKVYFCKKGGDVLLIGKINVYQSMSEMARNRDYDKRLVASWPPKAIQV